jgi:hypothetical protein
MSVLTLEGFVENGQIRLLNEAKLPEGARVYIVVPDAPGPAPRIWSPRLADPGQAAVFSMQVSEHGPGGTENEV